MSGKTCTIDGCDRPYRARGWCGTHWLRWRTHGDPHYVAVIVGDDEARFWSKVDAAGPCWEWNGTRRKTGHGRFAVNGRHVSAFTYSYELLVGPIPDGLELDHLCRNPPCVNPDHLEPVTHRENLMRGFGAAARNARKAECKRGHLFTAENTHVDRDGYRQCITCHDEYRHPRKIEAQRERRKANR